MLNGLAWIVIAIGVVLGCLCIYSLGYALIVPDTSGSPDARGMVFGASMLGLFFIALPLQLIGLALLLLAMRMKGHRG